MEIETEIVAVENNCSPGLLHALQTLNAEHRVLKHEGKQQNAPQRFGAPSTFSKVVKCFNIVSPRFCSRTCGRRIPPW